MQRILGQMRRAVTEYNMIEDGDKIAVGISGGKDSMALLVGLARIREFMGIDYELLAITLDPGFGGVWGDYSAVQEICDKYNVPYKLIRSEIGPIVFDRREESNPCSLCARMRRGALHDAAVADGCNKIALGHHMDDAVETFLMNLFREGRIGCFSPVTYLSRKDITMIRPLIFAEEREVRQAVNRNGIPIVKSVCPIDGHTEREWTKQFLKEMDKTHKGIKARLMGAIRRGEISGW